MQRNFIYYILPFIFLLTGCTTTFMGSVFVFTFSDLISYITIGLVVAALIAIFSGENWRKNFLLWVILNLLLTPLPGIIFFLIKLVGRKSD